MKCEKCKVNKLRREFPLEPITDNCDHAPLHCLRCVTQHVQAKNQCSYSACAAQVSTANPRYKEYLATLDRLFPTIETPEPLQASGATTANDTDATITVAMMGGETTVIPYQPLMTINDLKKTVKANLGVEPQKQRLLYTDKELKDYVDSKLANLQTYGVKPYSTLNLIVVLYNIPESFDEVIFDLFWGYPISGKDYLDASVLLYSGNSFVEVVDFQHTRSKSSSNAVFHSGDVMDDSNRRGHHTINVKLKSMAPHVDKLFFTLSSWNSPNISKYKNPSLRFFDARLPKKQLCSDSMSHAAYSQAIIMCSLCKIAGAWKVLSLRKVSPGNAKDYSPIQNTIVQLVNSGLS